MSLMSRAAALLGFATREAEADPAPERPRFLAPPNRAGLGWTSAERALSLISIYRAGFIHATSAVQLGVDVQRGDEAIAAPALVTRPDIETDREEFIEYTVNSLWLTGDAFWQHIRADRTSRTPGAIVSLTPLNPAEVSVRTDPSSRRSVYHHRNVEIPASDISHLKLYRVPGLDRGLGPIQAARLEVEGAIDARNYGASWFTESGMPSGLLTTDQVLNNEQAQEYLRIWEEGHTGRTRVLGQGLGYSPLMLKPADVQFLESQQFSTTQIARLFGIPAGLMLAAVEGKSLTYSNILEEWRGYLQFSAMKPLREIESKWTALLPGQQKVRFNMDGFLRLDTTARYTAHRTGIEAGFLTVNEVRQMEGLPPIAGGDTLTTTPAKETTDAAV